MWQVGDVGNVVLYGKKEQGGLRPSYHAYVKAYFDTYILLRIQIGDNEPNDYLYYPLLYILAHAIELTLKNIYSIWYKQNQKKLAYLKGKFSHDLRKLWDDEVKKILSTCKSRFSKDEINLLESIIVELNNIKRDSIVFKYPDQDTHSKERRAIDHLIIGVEKATEIMNLNDKFCEIEDMLADIRKLRLPENYISISDLEVIKSWSEVSWVDLNYIKSKYLKFHKEIIILLRIHYSLEINYKLKLKYIKISELRKIIGMASRMHSLEKKLYALYSKNIIQSDDNDDPLMQRELTTAIMQTWAWVECDPKLEKLKKELYEFLESLEKNSYWELELLLELGRNDISLVDYYRQQIGKEDLSSRVAFHNNFYKVRSNDYLLNSLRLLGYKIPPKSP